MIKWFLILLLIILFSGFTFYLGTEYGELSVDSLDEVYIDKENEVKSIIATSSSPGSYAYADFNFDGYEDRARLVGCGNANCSYTIQLFEAAKNNFYITPFSITNPQLNASEKIICSSNKGSANAYAFTIYKYEQDNFVEIYNQEVTLTEDAGGKDFARCTLK